MKRADLLREPWERLWAYPLRNGLTMFGVAWGCASVLVLGSFAHSAQRRQQQVVANYGRNIIVIKGGVAQSLGSRLGRVVLLDQSDVQSVLRGSTAISAATAEFVRAVSVASDFHASRVRVHGVDADYRSLRYMPVDQGRFVEPRDVRDGTRIAIVGAEIRRRLFGERQALGGTIRIEGMPYRIVGLLSEKEEYSGLEGPDSEMIVIPCTAFRKDLPLPPPALPSTVHHLLFVPRDPLLAGRAQREAVEILGRIHGFAPEDSGALGVWDTSYEAGLFTDMFSAIGRFFGAVGFTTLALGILGVMNVTLVSVSERIREIGVRRALGCTRRQVLASCLLESLMLTVASGLAGVGVAFLAVGAAGLAPLPETIAHPVIPVAAVFVVLASLVAGGAAAGVYPALRANAVDVISALREE